MKCQYCGAEILNESLPCPKCGKINKIGNEAFVSEEISSIWPEWKIEKMLGKGSFGVVYKAIRQDNNVESQAAIKIISIPSDSSEVDSLRSEGLDLAGTKTYFKGIVDDFVGEIQLMESLKGIQNIVSVEDYKVVEKKDSIGWDIYIRMELLTPFNSYICDKTFDEAETIKLGIDICTALEICGKRNIIHRDIKPENIFVNDFGYYKLGDFGIARKLENMTGGLSQKGTFNYMAPEVANSCNYDSRVDTYSLGIVLYRLLNNNKLPFLDTDKQLLSPNERKNAVERRIHGEVLPAPCNASPEMADLILRACAYDPNARFNSASEMKQALEDVANGKYMITENNLEETISVNRAQNECDATYAVRKRVKEEPVKTRVESFDEAKKVDTQIVNTSKDNKLKKSKFIGKGVLAGFVALAILFAILFFSSPAYGVYKNIKSSNFNEAISTYQSEVENSIIQTKLLNRLLKSRADRILTNYENGKLDYDSALEELNVLEKVNCAGAKDKINEVTSLNNATDAFNKAEVFDKDGDFENAILEYSKISENHEKYDAAQKRIKELSPEFIASVSKDAKEYNSLGRYKEAINRINTALEVLPDDSDITELNSIRKDSLSQYKTTVSDEVAAFVSENKYTEAFDLLQEAQELDDNTFFKDLKSSTEKDYVKYVTQTAEDYIANKSFDTAIRTVNHALTVLPNNSELKQLQSKIKSQKPTYLVDVLDPFESTNYEPIKEDQTVMMGGMERKNGFKLGQYFYDARAVYNLNKKYTSISGLVGFVDGASGSTSEVQFYLDDQWYATIKISSGNLPQEFSVDLTGVEKMEIKFENNGRTSEYLAVGFAEVEIK